MSNKVLWISLDPRTHKLTPYVDDTIQQQIEDAYKQHKNIEDAYKQHKNTVTLENYIAENNVTITFDDKKGHHQTTGPMDGQESGGKRSVKRLVFTPNENTQTLHIRRVRPDEIGITGVNWEYGDSLFATNDDIDETINKTININLTDILSNSNLFVRDLPDDASAPTLISDPTTTDPETAGGKKRKSKKSKKSKKRKSKKSKKSKKRKSKKSKKGKH